MTLTTLPRRRLAARPSRRFRFDVRRHDIRSTLPAAIQPMLQNGMLVAGFQQALAPQFLFPALADVKPWTARRGDTGTFTRSGLLTPVATPVTGGDPTPQKAGIEQWSMTMDQYGVATDTNMLPSAVALASEFAQDAINLAENAGESINLVARNRLYTAYRGGNTYSPIAAAAAATTIVVADPAGFGVVLVLGIPTPTSGANPKPVTINGVANTVTGVNVGTSTLTLGTALGAMVPAGSAVVAGDAPLIIRPNAKASAAAITAADTATFSMFRSGVARLRNMHVPTINGYYTAHIDPTTEAELFSDPEFKGLYQGRADSPTWQDLSIGRFAGVDWVRNTEAETVGNLTGITVHRPILMGGGALVAGPLEGFGSLASEVPGQTGYVKMIEVAPGLMIAYIIRPPQDRFQQVIGQAWSWVGDYSCPSDITERVPDPARYKRAVVLEHA